MLDYGIIGNCKTAGLIKKDGSVDWLCFPTFSSPSIFARILDTEKGGTFQIKPLGKYTVKQRYIEHTAILETTFTSQKDSFLVIDFFPRYKKLFSKKYERLVKENKLIRILKPLTGKPKLKVFFNPKPGYALQDCTFTVQEDKLICSSPALELALLSDIPFDAIRKQDTIELSKPKYVVVGSAEGMQKQSMRRCNQLLRGTRQYWEHWVETLTLPEENRELIIRSAITLKLLTYSETGAIIAAPTTSIPEENGTDRTFDYRYCWVRDAAFCADALKKIGRRYESKKLMEFIIRRALEDDYIQIMYGIHGETKLQEKELWHLQGFADSKPVRIGNAAYNQTQYDIYGEILDIMHLYFVFYKYDKKLTKEYWRFIRYVVNQIKFNWEKKDSGIWEFRELFRHYTYSKFMCFVGVDRAIKIAQHFQKEKYLQEWIALREEIRQDILEKGYNKKMKSFTMYYGGKDLDASLLHMAYYEFLEPNDVRLVNTVKAIDKRLRKNGFVQRYTIKDDFGVSTSAFTICSFWLADALVYVGEKEKARYIFKSLVKKANHVGLFSEDIDLKTKELRGNFPQAYTHIALINSAILLSEWSAKRKTIEMRKEKWY